MLRAREYSESADDAQANAATRALDVCVENSSAQRVDDAAASARCDGAAALPQNVAQHPPSGKPLVEAPEFGDRIRDTDKVPYWIPGTHPTIFQNETGGSYNYILKEPDLMTWGPHVMRSRG